MPLDRHGFYDYHLILFKHVDFIPCMICLILFMDQRKRLHVEMRGGGGFFMFVERQCLFCGLKEILLVKRKEASERAQGEWAGRKRFSRYCVWAWKVKHTHCQEVCSSLFIDTCVFM